MKLPRNYFESLSINKYREYLKLLPKLQNENTRVITTLILTFSAMSFFGIFAINPTLSTIVTLKKQLADSELVNEKLKTKISNLSSLQQKYSILASDLPIIYDAVPQSAKAADLLGQALSQSIRKNVQITSLAVSDIPITGGKNPAGESSFNFTIEARGTYENLMAFSKSLTNMNRIIAVDSLTMSKDAKQDILNLGLTGRGFFQK